MADGMPDFNILSGCTCPGYQVEYECTTVGRGATVWHGTAFDCPSNEITLRHSQFDSEYGIGQCNQGDICAHAESNGSNNHYTSKLTANVTLALNGQTISCSYDDGTNQHMINTSVVTITTGTK